jgi:hypothetical protein
LKTAHLCVSKEVKPAKIDSLIEKDFCARLLKDLSIFAGFGRRQAASRKINGRRFAPPTKWLLKNRNVWFWCALEGLNLGPSRCKRDALPLS